MVKSIKKNFFYQILYQALVLGLPLVVSPYLTRTLGSSSLGIYSYCSSIVTYFSIFVMLGIKVHGCRKIAQCKDLESERRMFYSLFFLHLLISIFVLFFYFCYFLFFGKEYLVIYFILTFYLLSFVFDVTWFYYGKENFGGVLIKNAVIKVVESVLIFSIIKSPSDLWIYALIMSCSIFLGQIVLLPPIVKKHRIYLPTRKDFSPHIKPLLILTISIIAIDVYTVFDKTLIGIFINDNKESVAFYDYSEKIAKLPITILAVMGTVLLPRMSSLSAHDDLEKMKAILLKANILISCLACGACFGMMAISHILMPIYYGEDFSICGDYLFLLCPLIIIITFGASVRNSFMIPRGMDSKYLISLLVASFFNLLLNFLLIPVIGVLGAIVGTIASEIIACLLQFMFVRKELPIWKYALELIPFLLLGVLMFVEIQMINTFLDKTTITIVIDIVVGGLSYLLLSLFYLLLTHKWIFKGLMSKKIIVI